MEALALERGNDGWRIRLNGDWSLAAMPKIDRDLRALNLSLDAPLICDWTHAAAPGIAPAWALLRRIARMNAGKFPVSHLGGPGVLDLLERLTAGEGAPAAAESKPPQEGAVRALGRWTLQQAVEARGAVGFFGRMVSVIGETFSRPRALRPSSIVRHVYETGITAIPIVSLIAFLISVIVAYLGSQQLSKFGADIFVVDLVTISVLREMGVLLTAIIVAGRSGSAFAAELGVMRLNEEVDALRAMGMIPVEILVLPRVLGLLIALPLLTIVADAMGLAGGGLLSLVDLHIPLPQFISRLREALAPTTFWAGIVKAPVFAVLIGMVGTYRGMQVRDSARELGRLTTVAVVQSIFMVILADALFAVVFMKLDF